MDSISSESKVNELLTKFVSSFTHRVRTKISVLSNDLFYLSKISKCSDDLPSDRTIAELSELLSFMDALFPESSLDATSLEVIASVIEKVFRQRYPQTITTINKATILVSGTAIEEFIARNKWEQPPANLPSLAELLELPGEPLLFFLELALVTTTKRLSIELSSSGKLSFYVL